jgi:polyketide biosynthesis enoyl-CoA hydratase PksH
MTDAEQPVRVARDGVATRVRLTRPQAGNTLTPELVRALHGALDAAEAEPSCRVVVLEGADGVFCTGLDFERLLAGDAAGGDDAVGEETARFAELLRRLAYGPCVVVSAVDGRVVAGGVGLVAASDLVYVTGRATFALTEALWGLLPCVVAPYLIRRVGFRMAYEMTLTARTVTAAEAAAAGLADAQVDDLDAHLDLQVKRLARLDRSTVVDLKRYYGQLGAVAPESDRAALVELRRLLGSPRVRRNLEAWTRYGRLPWESS